MRNLDILISLSESVSNEMNEALKSLKLIAELDPERNDAETYRDAVRIILYNGGWLN